MRALGGMLTGGLEMPAPIELTEEEYKDAITGALVDAAMGLLQIEYPMHRAGQIKILRTIANDKALDDAILLVSKKIKEIVTSDER